MTPHFLRHTLVHWTFSVPFDTHSMENRRIQQKFCQSYVSSLPCQKALRIDVTVQYASKQRHKYDSGNAESNQTPPFDHGGSSDIEEMTRQRGSAAQANRQKKIATVQKRRRGAPLGCNEGTGGPLATTPIWDAPSIFSPKPAPHFR